jgi:hypothetical protein
MRRAKYAKKRAAQRMESERVRERNGSEWGPKLKEGEGGREGRIFNGSYRLSLVQGSESPRRKTNEHGDLERMSKTGGENLRRRKKRCSHYSIAAPTLRTFSQFS